MKLTKHTDYAFRVLIYLASLNGEKTTIQVITEKFAISKTHLMKVVNELVNKNWVRSTRGKNGGICLAKPAEEIALSEVIEYMEAQLDPINCTLPPCYIKSVCSLKPILLEAQREYLRYLSRFTIADLTDSETSAILFLGS